MELVIAAQDDAIPWERQQPKLTGELHGRGHFSRLGVVRRKPSRPDASPTLSKSCTDKLALTQALSFLNSVSSPMIECAGAYLSTLTLPHSQYSEGACQRAFSAIGRLASLSQIGLMQTFGREFHAFRIKTTKTEFKYSRRAMAGKKIIASNIAATWSPHFEETLISGILQGRKSGDVQGASKVSRRHMVHLLLRLTNSALLRHETNLDGIYMDVTRGLRQLTDVSHYSDLKDISMLEGRRHAKATVISLALHGWLRNVSDDFSLLPSMFMGQVQVF